MGNLFQRCYTIEGRHDFATGLLYHAWDESRKQRWSNPETGQSKHFWSCATGWYLMGIVDVLDFLPENHPDRESLIEILNRVSSALLKVQDKNTGLWYQVLDMGGREGNYVEGSGSAMYTYVFAKGAKKAICRINIFNLPTKALMPSPGS